MSGQAHSIRHSTQVAEQAGQSQVTTGSLVMGWFAALPRLISRRWLLASVLVLFGIGLTVRLGIWQLDRLESRRAFNARVLAQQSRPPLVLSGVAPGAILDEALDEMEYRPVEVSGEYDFDHQVALRNQAWGNRIGVHLLTPLRIAGSQRYVLVDRGWIPGVWETGGQLAGSDDWAQYQEPDQVTVMGVIRASQDKPDFGHRSDPLPGPGEWLAVWNFVNLPGIASQLPYDLLPVYIQQAPTTGSEALPFRTRPELDLTEGPHMGYAIQWFSFAGLLFLGYPLYVRRQEQRHPSPSNRSEG